MNSLDFDLQKPKISISEFEDLTIRILDYLPNVLSNCIQKNGYDLFSLNIAGTIKIIRPIRKDLFIGKSEEFKQAFIQLRTIFERIRSDERKFNLEDKFLIDKTLYTIQQSIGAGLDLMVNPNSARKHAGNRFEELIKVIFSEAGVANKKIVLQIPYETEEGSKVYKCENDLIISPYEKVKSTSKTLCESEIVVSAKTSSKDRMGKIFIDKILLERFVEHPQKVIGIFLNDVQRKGNDNISFTLVSGLFMVYSKFLTKIEGIYYFDLPSIAKKPPYSKYMKQFSELLITDLKCLFSS